MKETVIFDGAIGTYFHDTVTDSVPCELGNILRREDILNIQRRYVACGITALKTNTFAAHIMPLPEGVCREELFTTGYKIALQAAGEGVEVYADIGGINNDTDDTEDAYLYAAKTFATSGADKFLFETLPEFEPILPAVDYISKNVKNARIIVSFAVSADGYTRKGLYYKTLLDAAHADGRIFARGLNCICGPSHMYRLIKEICPLDGNFIAMPNSGYPSVEEGRTVYHNNPDYYSDRLRDIYSLGVNIVGGCCGTTPEHIRKTVQKISSCGLFDGQTVSERTECESVAECNPIIEKLAAGKKLLTFELDPPVDCDISRLAEAARLYADAGADLITLTDSPIARTRADSFMTAAYIKRLTGADTSPHICCRDRNHIAIKGALLSGAQEGIRTVLAVTGDALPQGTDKRKASDTFNSYELIAMCANLNETVFKGREYLISAALNVNALNFENELKRAQKKECLGAGLFFTQPIYRKSACENVRLASSTLKSPVVVGLMPPAGYKNAVFLNNEVKGIDIPREIIDSLEGKTREEAYDISCRYMLRLMEEVNNCCAGFLFMTPLGKTELILKLVKLAKEKGII